MFLLWQILPATVVGMMAAAGVCALALACGNERARSVLGPLAVGIGYVTGHLFITGWVSFPPADTTNWLPYFAATAATLGAFCALWRIRIWARVLIFALVSLGTMRLLLKPKFQYAWSVTEGWTWVLCLGTASVLLAIILGAVVWRSVNAVEVPVFLMVICAGTFGALMLSGSILLGEFAAVLGAAVFGTLVLAVRKISLGRGIVPLFSLLTSALLVSGYFFAVLPAVSAGLLAFAPVPGLIPIGLRNRSLALGIRTAFVLLPVAVALVVAYLSSPPLDY